MLQASRSPLWEAYDLAMLDLDGVVYIGADAVPGAADHLQRTVAAGMRLAFVTNNAARPPLAVAEHLRALGVPADAEDVVTSAQAAARLLANRCAPGSAVFVIGGQGLFEALEERDLRPVQDVAVRPEAVVSGYHRDLRWGTVSDGAILVAQGLLWVAANTDMSVPTVHGRGPGNGVLVETVARFAGAEPIVAGKPRPPLFEETVLRVGGTRPLVVGDRLDTDIEGAVAGGYDSLLVLTGVTGIEELVTARPHQRPTYLASDLGGLGRTHPESRLMEDGDGATVVEVGTLSARIRDGHLLIDHAQGGGGEHRGFGGRVGGRPAVVHGGEQADDWWRAVAGAAWHHFDTTGKPVSVDGLRAPSTVASRDGETASP